MRGALNLYTATENAFDVHARTLAGLFGVQAALLIYGSSQASTCRPRWTAATGSAGQGRPPGTASQDTNLKLTAVARWLTENARTTGGSGPNLELDSTL